MIDLKASLGKLHKNINILKEREAKFGGNPPLDLLNQIQDHENAIALTEHAIRGEISETEWREALKPLLVSLNVFGEFFGPRVPLQRPPRAEHFQDRQAELAQLLADLQPGRAVTLCGPGGIGKSALAAEALWTLAPGDEPPERFSDGIIFHTFYGQPDPTLALEHIALSLGEEPKPTPAEAALRALANRQALLILDGTEEAANLPAVLEVRGNCGVLITSRTRKDAVAERQDLKPLTADDAVALLHKWGGDQAAEVQAAEEICKRMGHLPLAVRLAGRYLAETGQPAAEYLEWLQATLLEALDQGQRRLESVPLLLNRSLAQVSDQARQVLAVVGLLALVPFGHDPIAVAREVSAPALYQPLGELVRYGLLSRNGDRYEVTHALIHTYARQRLSVPGEVVERLATYYTALAKEQRQRGLAGYLRLDAERPHLMRVLTICVEGEAWLEASDLVWYIKDYLDLRGYWMERITALELGLRAAQKRSDRYKEGAFVSMLGETYHDLGQMERAIECYEQALTIAREIGNRRGEGADLANLGNAYLALRQVKRAIEYHQQALTTAREIGDRLGEGADLGNLGNAYLALGQMERAIECYEQALTIAREIGHRRGEAVNVGNLGRAYRDLGQVERAIEYHQQALTIAREIGSRLDEAAQLNNLGKAYRDLGQAEQAKQYFQQSLAILEEIKSPYTGFVRNELAQLESDSTSPSPSS
ncbi:MAG: hypothetical protein DPW09_11090 [Anaerolineae bacterium]|nr:hypothetical protein [Anaerolineae bacterium]